MLENCTNDTASCAAGDRAVGEAYEQDWLKFPVVRVGMVLAYGAVFFGSLAGNLFVFVNILLDRKMHTVTNIFVGNLACADLLMCTFSVAFTPLSLLADGWSFGTAVCKLIPTTAAMSVFVISWTSTLIAIHRYVVIVHPHYRRMRVGHAVACNVAVWLVAVSGTLPIAFHQEVVDRNQDGISVCSEEWDDNLKYRALYTYSCLALQYVVPVGIIAFAYANILVTLDRRLKTHLSKCPNSQRASRIAKLVNKRRVTCVLMIMLGSFMVCWVPINVLNMLAEHYPDYLRGHGIATFIVCHLIASVSTIFNAVLYAGMNEDFKRRLQLCGIVRFQICKRFQLRFQL